MTSEILAHVIRGKTVESVHRGHFIVMDGNGNTVASAGNPKTVTYFRSACKPHQSIPLITSGAADAFGFTEDEIAMSCASHSGEPMHVEIVRRMLEKIGMAESDLRCGIHYPFSETESRRMQRAGESPTQLHNNCSGKHTGMLALAKHIGADVANYEDPAHRVQQRILRAIAEFTELPTETIAIGIDGCAVPNFAVPVEAMARSFINLIAPGKLHMAIQSAASRVVSAMLSYPELIGGTERFDTILMQAAHGRLISKVGADGVWLCGVLPCERYPSGLGIAIKIEDGDDLYSRSVVAIELLRRLGVLAPDALADLSPMPIKNRRGDKVGEIVSMG
ncbi:asparaginase [soil metagenome]